MSSVIYSFESTFYGFWKKEWESADSQDSFKKEEIGKEGRGVSLTKSLMEGLRLEACISLMVKELSILRSDKIPLSIPSSPLQSSFWTGPWLTMLLFESFNLVEQNGVGTWVRRDVPDLLWKASWFLKLVSKLWPYKSSCFPVTF